ncbi:hypothetical protein P43SY_000345 [Pythium insidiosum]|uniref:TsaA-like domain-containing protein n=1 Tax=Pythium insidiosum TaxID=114742 RepID=A0AAD5LHF8_PYTIN|nr:hypothetical protein P43SY_000345 [Pythium insidiosum]
MLLPSSVVSSALCVVAGVALGWQLASASQINWPRNGDGGKDKVIAELQREVEKQKKLRAQERSGRTNAEREAREAVQRQQEAEGYHFHSIGHVQSCFAERRGTPRQSALVPDARGRIKLRPHIPPASLECLEQFSHMWVVFVFHENTNVVKQTGKSKFAAKIAPPRLGGQKVGLFSTRTPHRPNSIGLTVVKIEAVYGKYIEISGHDLVNGTPVLDVKPYVPMDMVPAHVCPHWVTDPSDALPRPVEFQESAQLALRDMVERGQLRFYTALADITAAIKQMLVLDIRSVHQGRGRADEEQIFMCRFDNVEIEFQTLEDKILVVSCRRAPSTSSE